MRLSFHFLATVSFAASLLIIFLPAGAAPAAGAHALSDKIAAARAAGQVFREATLFAPAQGPKHAAILDAETSLEALAGPVSELFALHPQAVSLTVKTAAGKAYTLQMLRSYPTGDAPDMGVIDASGRRRAAYTPGLHYQGAVSGSEQSMAAMSVFEGGEVMILFATEEGNFVLGRLEDGSGKYILYNDRDLHGRGATPCGTVDVPPAPADLSATPTGKTAKAYMCGKVRIYWELSNKLYTYKSSSLLTTRNWATGLFNQFQAMYANERIAVELSSLYVWTTPDDYPTTGSTSGTSLGLFRKYWNALGNSYNGDLAHILTRTGNGNGGVAYLDALCTPKSYSFAYSDVNGSYNAIPTFSWDVEVTTHETGHNLGSNHTHWCGWNTGSGGACGAIDDCYNLESGSSCTTCGVTYSNSAPTSAWQGTVMSYCHLVSRGISLANGFGPLPGAAIRNKVAGAGCLQTTINAILTPQPVCGSTGGISLQLATNNFGAAPYTYSWSSGATTQNLMGLSSAGSYTVTVKDSNNCSGTFTADVTRSPAPGAGIASSLKMPLCCNSFNGPLLLKAAAPQDLTACQTVYWLRSHAAFASLADAQAFADTASALNVLKSANEGSIANGLTGASLSVEPEPCTAPVTWYYTPIVMNQPHAADSVITVSSASTSFTVQGVQVGAYATIPDQTSAPTACDLTDSPSSKSLSVTVTNYSGRVGKLRIIILNTAGFVIYQSPGYSGNGTYAVPDSLTSGAFLQGMKVIAMDYNCTTTSCTSSLGSVSVARKVVYDMHPARPADACAPGNPVRVDFAPTACTKLAVTATGTGITDAKLFPNPATESVILRFTAPQNGSYRLRLTDMLGKTILSQDAAYAGGSHDIRLNLSGWAKGVYFVSFGATGDSAGQWKLVVE